MGIRGLRSFIINKEILKPYQLEATCVVINGNSVCHQILDKGSARHFGGNYEVIRENIFIFFRSLLQCNVKPYVVFDGAFGDNNKKMSNFNTTNQFRMKKTKKNIPTNFECFPNLVYEVFIAVLDELKIQHIACEGESNNQIAVLARRWECPVISGDLDFYIFDLPGGFINFEDIPYDENSSGLINTQLYLIDNFQSEIQFPKSLMALAAIVLDNIYENINNDIINRFFRHVGANGKPKNLDEAFAHLSRFKTNENAILILKQCVDDSSVVSSNEQDRLKTDIDSSIRFYSSVDRFTDFDIAHCFEGKTAAVHRRNLPDSVMEKIRNGAISCLPIDITIGRVFLKPTIEMYPWRPVQEITRQIRQVVYGLVIKSSNLQFDTVEEVIRHYMKMEKIPVKPVNKIEGIGSIPTLQEIENHDNQYKNNFLAVVFRAAAKSTVEIPDSSLLYVYALRYFLGQTNFQISRLLPYLYSFSHIILSNKGDIMGLRDVYDRVVAMDVEQDVGFFHNFLQLFHECLNMAYFMNALIGCPVLQPDPATVYDGKFMYNLFKTYNNEAVIKEAISKIKSKAILDLYERMVSAVSDA